MELVKAEYTTAELVQVFGTSKNSVLRRADSEKWERVSRTGRGGGFAYPVASMPQPTRQALAAALVTQEQPEATPATTANLPAIAPPSSLAAFNAKQRATAEARLALLREVERLVAVVGKEAAIAKLVGAAADGTLAPHLQRLVPLANDKFKDGGKRGLSRRRLYAWGAAFAADGIVALVPQRAGRDMRVPAWAPLFLQYYQKPQKPSLSLAYRDFCMEFAALGQGTPPSYHAVRRWLTKMALPELQAGRLTGNALLKLKTHKRRSTNELFPGDVYTADGTTFDAEIAHPYSGNPFKPEITGVVDVATRKCVGASLALSESAYTVLDALRMGCLYGGIPALFYSDNGPGYRNALLEAPGMGMFARLGIELTNAIPGRPQGKGLMERAVKTLCEDAAKRLTSCTHKDMDSDVGKKVFKLTRADIKKYGKSPLLPTWEEFKTAILNRIDEYNNAPHRSLPKIVDSATGKRRHMSPNEMWQRFAESGQWEPTLVPDDVKEDLFMPSERRKVRNGMVQFYNGTYFAAELENFHLDHVEVRYDIWDSSEVQVYVPGGAKICTAKLDGNVIPYFPKSRIEAARDTRQKAQILRLENKVKAIAPGARIELPEAAPTFTVADFFTPDTRQSEQQGVLLDVTPAPALEQQAAAAPERRPVFMDSFQKFEWLMRNQGEQTATDQAWLAAYAQTGEYAEFKDLYTAKGIAYGAASAIAL